MINTLMVTLQMKDCLKKENENITAFHDYRMFGFQFDSGEGWVWSMEHATTPGSVNGKREANVQDFRPDGLLLRVLFLIGNYSEIASRISLLTSNF